MLINISNKTIPLLNARGIANSISCNNNSIKLESDLFIKEIINKISNNSSVLPLNPGFEVHPYKGILKNIESQKYIIGTFPPISYLIDSIRNQNVNISALKQPTCPHQKIDEPKIPFFHGNVSGLWSALFSDKDLFELKSKGNRFEAKEFIINWLIENNIYYDDIIQSTQRKLGQIKPNKNLGYTPEDVNLYHICPNINLICKVLTNQELQVVCFTNGMMFRTKGLIVLDSGLVDTKNSDGLSIFLRACQNIGLKIEMQCLPYFDWIDIEDLNEIQKRTKLIFKLRFSKTNSCHEAKFLNFEEKTITILVPFSPAAHGKIESHPIVISMKEHFGAKLSASKLLSKIYEKFRNDSFEELYQYNINI